MPHKETNDANGVKNKSRSKADKSRRNFELHGSYSSKHLRLREARVNTVTQPETKPEGKGKVKGRG